MQHDNNIIFVNSKSDYLIISRFTEMLCDDDITNLIYRLELGKSVAMQSVLSRSGRSRFLSY